MRSLLWTVLSPGLNRKCIAIKGGKKRRWGQWHQLTGGTTSNGHRSSWAPVEGALSDNPYPLPLGKLLFNSLKKNNFKIKKIFNCGKIHIT